MSAGEWFVTLTVAGPALVIGVYALMMVYGFAVLVVRAALDHRAYRRLHRMNSHRPLTGGGTDG